MITKNEIIKILKENSFEYYGIRGIDNREYLLNDYVDDESFAWDMDMDRSTYGTENEASLGGISTTLANHFGPHYLEFNRNYDFEESAECVLQAITFHDDFYCYNNIYLLGSNELDTDSPNDENEGVLYGAKALIKL